MIFEDDKKCFACGSENSRGLHLKFSYGTDSATSRFTASADLQGYKDVTHGGIISTLLDEVMVHAALKDGAMPATAEITVRFKKPMITGQPVILEGNVTRRTSRLIETRGVIKSESDGSIIAEATAKLLK
ncbi:MAG: PaaI family thioesterase [Nitrospiraceae bacterium]|nr:PaaI family thioesterase [Nitrospiraceae bacterium]